jgi:hypothetical protein
MKSYESVQSELNPDGSFRDIYIYQANSDVCNNYISLVLGSEQNHEFWHGENKISMPTNYEEIQSLQNTDPTTLKIFIEGGVQKNCHFFTEKEIDIDVAPNEIGEKPNLMV